MVFLGLRIPFNRKVFTAFTVLRQFLYERDEKRYKRYYEEKELSQYEKILEIRTEIENNRKAGYKIDDEFLYNHFDHGIIDGLMQSNQLIKQGDGQYVFGGWLIDFAHI